MEIEIIKVTEHPVATVLVDTDMLVCGQRMYFTSSGNASKDRRILTRLNHILEERRAILGL